jgi:hypothetical protein
VERSHASDANHVTRPTAADPGYLWYVRHFVQNTCRHMAMHPGILETYHNIGLTLQYGGDTRNTLLVIDDPTSPANFDLFKRYTHADF